MKENTTRFVSAYLREWGAILLGLTLFVLSLPLYESYSSRVVLGRWSHVYTAFTATAYSFWLGMLVWSVARTRRGGREISASKRLFGASVALWGTAYMIAALDSHASAGRILDLNVVGSDQPIAALIEFASLSFGLLAAISFFARRLPKRWQNAGVFVATTALLILVGEGVARVKAVAFPATQGFPTYSSALWSRRYVKLNSLGFRDVEHEKVKAPNTKRLLVIGDSFTFGVGIESVGDRFGELTARELDKRTREEWEPVNGGVPDTHTLQHIGQLKRLIDFDPDVTVLLYVFNDMDYLSPVTDRSRLAGPKTFAEKYSPDRVLFLNSYLYQEIFVRLRMVRFMMGAETAGPSPYDDDSLLARHMEDLGKFVAIARAGGSAVLIVPYDNSIEASPALAEQYRHFLNAARSHGLPACSLADTFKDLPVKSLRVNSLDGHPNAAANRLAAAQAAACIVATAIG